MLVQTLHIMDFLLNLILVSLCVTLHNLFLFLNPLFLSPLKQDFFLYLWERKEILPELQQPDAYLFSAVKHRCLNFLRSQLSIVDRRQPLSDIMEQEFKLKLYSLQLLDDSQMSIDEVEKQICRAIDNLPERCREIFVMSKLKGMKYREIAGALGISQNTVEGQMAIALKKLREELRHCLPLLLLLSV